jgi:hypothetical protein
VISLFSKVNFGSAIRSLSIFGLLIALTSGCQSTPKQRVASVAVRNASAEQLKTAAEEVFEQHSFEYAPEDDNDLVFQRKGSGMNSFLYGDWYQGAVWIRIKLFLTDLKSGRTLVDCEVYMVQEHDDPFFQKERKVKANKTECQKILNEIAATLNTPASHP